MVDGNGGRDGTERSESENNTVGDVGQSPVT